MDCGAPGLPVLHHLPELAQTEVHWVSDAIQPSHPLLLTSALNLSQHWGFFPMSWLFASGGQSFSFGASSLELQLQHQSFQWIFRTNQYTLHIWSHLILITWSYDAGSTVNLHFTKSQRVCYIVSFRMDWLYLLTVQGTLKSLLQHHSSKASILRHSALFLIQLSHPYTTTGKIIALIRLIFISKVISLSLLFTILSRMIIAFLPRSKVLLISWLQSSSAVILKPKKIKSVTVSLFPHLFGMKWWDQIPWSSFF